MKLFVASNIHGHAKAIESRLARAGFEGQYESHICNYLNEKYSADNIRPRGAVAIRIEKI